MGLGLWNSVPATVAVEGALFGLGVWLYVTGTRALDRTGRNAVWALVGFLAALYAGNLLGPPPPSPRAVAWVGGGLFLLIAWAWWADRHRAPVGA